MRKNKDQRPVRNTLIEQLTVLQKANKLDEYVDWVEARIIEYRVQFDVKGQFGILGEVITETHLVSMIKRDWKEKQVPLPHALKDRLIRYALYRLVEISRRRLKEVPDGNYEE